MDDLKKSEWRSRLSVAGVIGFVTAPVWTKFIDAWLEQNKVFIDPNSIVRVSVQVLAEFFSKPIVTHFIAFALVVIATLMARHYFTRATPESILPVKAPQTPDKQQILDTIVGSLERVISESNLSPTQVMHGETVEGSFRNQISNLNSFNLTLEKYGFSKVDFQNYSSEERNELIHIRDTLLAMTRDGHIEEAYAEAKSLFSKADKHIDRVDNRRRIRWVTEDDGSLYCTNTDYFIAGDRLHETTTRNGQEMYDWPVHLSSKTWFELGPFLDVFKAALQSSERGVDGEKYKRSIKLAHEIFRKTQSHR